VKDAKGRFVVRLWVAGKRLHRVFGTRKDAAAFTARVQADLDRFEATGVRPLEQRGFSQFVEREYLPYCEREHTATTFQSEKARLLKAAKFFGGSLVSAIQTPDIERYLTTTAKKAGIASRNRIASYISGAFRYAGVLGYRRGDDNPVRGIQWNREEERDVPLLSGEQEATLVECCPTRIRPIIQILLGTGVRLGDALRLRWQDVDLENHRLSVAISKNKRTRAVPLSSSVETVFEALKRNRGPRPIDGPDRVFWSIPISSHGGSVRTAFKTAVTAAKLPEGFRIHDCRHVFSVNAVKRGVSLPELAAINGHSLVMAMRYSRHVPENVVDLVRKKLEVQTPPPPATPAEATAAKAG
jgi:integrase